LKKFCVVMVPLVVLPCRMARYWLKVAVPWMEGWLTCWCSYRLVGPFRCCQRRRDLAESA
jgi:hypothetical protein